MAPHSSTLAWKIPWMEEPGGLQSMGPLRVRHNWATSLLCIGEENGNPLQCSCLENPRYRGAWWAAVYGVAQSRAQLKWLSSSSSSSSRLGENEWKRGVIRAVLYEDWSFWECFMKINLSGSALWRLIWGICLKREKLVEKSVGRPV